MEAAATRSEVFLDPDGQVDPRKSRDTGLGVGVPGTVAGLALALERYGSGKFTFAELIAPAVRLAREGVPIRYDLYDSLLLAQPRLALIAIIQPGDVMVEEAQDLGIDAQRRYVIEL